MRNCDVRSAAACARPASRPHASADAAAPHRAWAIGHVRGARGVAGSGRGSRTPSPAQRMSGMYGVCRDRGYCTADCCLLALRPFAVRCPLVPAGAAALPRCRRGTWVVGRGGWRGRVARRRSVYGCGGFGQGTCGSARGLVVHRFVNSSGSGLRYAFIQRDRVRRMTESERYTLRRNNRTESAALLADT